ncbi:helix-turn-helix domain-containing protein [Limosilactobacillus reuteri]|uniref:helix-turn-helix domain-containing protein n=1 Tax=Limosilactobacillus reuteri TaxID=1598 RepID=UPI003D02D162
MSENKKLPQNRIAKLRKEKNLSQAQLAKETGLTRQAISLYEIGKREPKLETWVKLADFFNVPVPYLQGIAFKGFKFGSNDSFEQIAYDYGLLDNYAEFANNISEDKRKTISEAVILFKSTIIQLLEMDNRYKSDTYQEYLKSLIGVVYFLSVSINSDKIGNEKQRQKVMKCYIKGIEKFAEYVSKSSIADLVLDNKDGKDK